MASTVVNGLMKAETDNCMHKSNIWLMYTIKVHFRKLSLKIHSLSNLKFYTNDLFDITSFHKPGLE